MNHHPPKLAPAALLVLKQLQKLAETYTSVSSGLLAGPLGLDLASVNYQLRTLEEAGLVQKVQEGRVGSGYAWRLTDPITKQSAPAIIMEQGKSRFVCKAMGCRYTKQPGKDLCAQCTTLKLSRMPRRRAEMVDFAPTAYRVTMP